MVSAELVAAVAGPAEPPIMPDVVTTASEAHSSEGSNSLARRSRVRRRNSRRDEDSSSDILSTSGDISSSQLFVKIPPADTLSGSSPKALSALESGVPPRPPRSPQRLQTAPASNLKWEDPDEQRGPRQRTRSVDPSTTRPVIDDIRGRQTRSENGLAKRNQLYRGASLPRYAFRNSFSDSSEQPSPLTPSVFNDVPQIPSFAQYRRFRHQPRDSGVTQQSTTSSSLYPKSTSTEGSYPSLPSLPAQDVDDRFILTVDPESESQLDALHEMDGDEVSYRLRLLMQNNYYLPPAHSKPFSEVPQADTPKKSPNKSSSPAFFDIFKVVKKKSSASADNKTTMAPPAPILRTTSDSSTLSGLLRPQQSSGHGNHLRVSRPSPQVDQEHKGRVVVVRERVDDLVTVAKQVEEELKARETERQQNASETSRSERVFAQFVDPTDSIDLPSVPSNEYFGPQAALIRGMGIDSSLGAALLADQLPPVSPGSWSGESEDVAWRKAILHAAVDHSLNSSSGATPARSTSSSSSRPFDLPSPREAVTTSPSMPPRSPASPASSHAPFPPTVASGVVNTNASTGANEKRKDAFIGQPILSRIVDEVANMEAMSSANVETASGSGLQSGQQPAERPQNLLVTAVPIRASSPTVPTTPLRPPPRRPSQTPLNSSGSGSDNVQDNNKQDEDNELEVDAGRIQAQQDVPLRLSDAYESHVGLSGSFGKLTPPASQRASTATTSGVPGIRISSRGAESISTTSGSRYSDEGELSTFHTPQEQTLASTFADSRPSLASCGSSQASPTTSAFRDAHDRSYYSGSTASLSDVNTLGGNSRVASRISNINDPRYAVVTPPPRVSSMLARNISNASSRQPHAAREDSGSLTALHVPRLTVHDLQAEASRASPYTASPISFFDAVEMQSRQDDDEESSESESEEDSSSGELASLDTRDDVSVMSTSASVNTYRSEPGSRASTDPRVGSSHSLQAGPRRAVGSFTQQRNASLPQLGPRGASAERAGFGFDVDRWKAISNVPESPSRLSFWHKKYGKQPELFPNPPRVSESTVDWVKHEEAKEASTSAKRPHTSGSNTLDKDRHSRKAEQDNQDPSVRRLDGLLIEHMEREKEVLKRITTTLTKTPT